MTKNILVMTANPKNTLPLRLDEEVREIDEGLRRAERRDEFALKQKWAVRYRDVYRAMLDENPNIVHFSGHGSSKKGIVLEDRNGKAKHASAESLAGLFKAFAERFEIECVVLNACYSEEQAAAIVEHIPYVIGMKKAIADDDAIAFAVAFYDALGAGKDIEFAYALAQSVLPPSPHPMSVLKKAEKAEKALVSGSINFPNPDDLVARSFRAEGSINKLPSGSHLYMVVEVGSLLWPKEAEVTERETSWSAQVYEGGEPPNGRFALCLYLVGNEGHRQITDWLENGKRTGHYPGLQEIKGGQRLHSINLRLQQFC